MPLLEAPAWHQFHADACDRGQSLKAIKPGKFNHPREHEAQHSAHTLLWKKSIPRRPDPISNSGTKSSPRQNTCDWYLPRTSSRFLNSVGKTESGGITRFISGKLRTAPKRCFPLSAVWPPPSIYLIHTPTAAHPSSISSNPDSTNQIHPSLIPSTKAINSSTLLCCNP